MGNAMTQNAVISCTIAVRVDLCFDLTSVQFYHSQRN